MLEVGRPQQFGVGGPSPLAGAGAPDTVIKGFILTTAGAAATADIREGGASGTIVLSLACPVNDQRVVDVQIVIRDPYYTLAGAGAKLTALM